VHLNAAPEGDITLELAPLPAWVVLTETGNWRLLDRGFSGYLLELTIGDGSNMLAWGDFPARKAIY